jgi:UDP-N-acetyl-D-galactosamine dehydrogenase|tara:strand:+ start:2018 stop:3292 length:1275 start_codon:yes stop_codon:yes gene_type:complete
MKDNNLNIAVIGLGYVGLPLAIEFGKKRNVVGFDINEKRIESLKQGKDSTLECSETEIKDAKYVSFTSTLDNLKECNCFIVTVPTPIDDKNIPDLKPLEKATEMIGAILKKEDLVIYESTVFPGATEEFCVPILEKKSSLEYKKDFSCGYSPERINPGDKNHRIKNIKKVTSGSSDEVANIVDNLYKEIIEAGTHKAESIKVAEAAKVIENTQRDLNIALINELSLIFNKMGIDTESVLDAAGSKWNFLPFKPGLVGGHCIGVDPYYLTYKAQEIGYNPEIILAGRKLNDYMSKYVSSVILKELSSRNIKYEKSSVLVMGMTFKENCPDTRNTKVTDVITRLKDKGCSVDVYDPWIDQENFKNDLDINFINILESGSYDAILIAVAHDEFICLDKNIFKDLKKEKGFIYDLKHILPKDISDLRL